MRRLSVVGALLLGVVGALDLACPVATAAPPNVLIIVTDDQRAVDTMWVMPKTRNRFVGQGVRYPRGFATTPLCCPSRVTILTGRYAHNTGVHSNGPPRALDRTTMFPRLLRNAGYRTAMVGKFLNSWPMTTAPPYFDRWALEGGQPYLDPTFNVNGTIKTVPGYSTSLVGNFAIRFLHRFVDRYNHALWSQRQYQGPGQAERAARYLSKYVSKERAADWLREKVGQRVFYVAPWLSQAAGASMRIARLGRRIWASKHGYCERPRCTDEDLEAVMRFLAACDGSPERAP